jgi:hypothetical protein
MRSLAVVFLALSLLSGSAIVTAEAQSTTQQRQTTPRSTQPAPAPSTGTTTAPAAQAGQFSTEASAKQHCPSDNVVWANTKSMIYHYAGTKDYGKTKEGAFMCQQESNRGGFRAAKNEKAPAKS